MAISPIIGSPTQTQELIKPSVASKLQAALGAVNGVLGGDRDTDSVSAITLATQLQVQTTGFKQVSSKLAQGSSLVQVAREGAEEIQKDLKELRKLAEQAKSTSLNTAERKVLDDKFQALAKDIDLVVDNTKFGDQKLLNGDLSGKNALSLEQLFTLNGENNAPAPDADSLVLEDLSSEALIGKAQNLKTADAADKALTAVEKALNTVGDTLANADSFIKAVDHIAAHFASAEANIIASQSLFQPTDFSDDGSNQFSLLDLQKNVSKALAAQAKNLPSNLTSLIG